jgi:hypothetical protein
MGPGIFTAVANEGEIAVLRRLHGILEKGAVENRDQFSDLMKAAFKNCRLEYIALADDLGYSAISVHRWIEGISAPHKSLWPLIIEWIMKEIEERERSYTNNKQDSAVFN